MEVGSQSSLVETLHQNCELSRNQIKQAMNKGAVWLRRGNSKPRRLRRAKAGVQPGDVLYLYYDSRVLEEKPLEASLIADEGEYSVWFKPSGMRTEGSKWGDHTTITRWAEQHLQPERPAFLVHRLDRAASGLLLLAHSKKSAARLSRLFRERRIGKHYHVCVHGKTPSELKLDSDIDGREARTACTRLGYDGEKDRSALDVEIATGRKHQIRRHLAEAGFPVVGDRLYGVQADSEDLMLVASRLTVPQTEPGVDRQYGLPASLNTILKDCEKSF